MNSRTLRAAFDRVAGSYDRHAALEREAGERLLERLAFLRREPERILDLGCGTGAAGEQLQQRFDAAQVICLDASPRMLEAVRRPPGTVRVVSGEHRDHEGRLVGLSGPRRWPGGAYAPGGFVELPGPAGSTERHCVPLTVLERLG